MPTMSSCERSRKSIPSMSSSSPPNTRCRSCGDWVSVTLMGAPQMILARRQMLGAARGVDEFCMEGSRCGGKRSMARRLAIISRLVAVEIGQAPPGLVEYEIGGGNVPIIGLVADQSRIDAAGCNAHEPHGERCHLRKRHDVGPGIAHAADETLRTREGGPLQRSPRGRVDGSAVHMRAAAACGAICLVDRRCMHNTRDRAALMHQADRHRPLWVAVGKAARAVDGVDDQHE